MGGQKQRCPQGREWRASSQLHSRTAQRPWAQASAWGSAVAAVPAAPTPPPHSLLDLGLTTSRPRPVLSFLDRLTIHLRPPLAPQPLCRAHPSMASPAQPLSRAESNPGSSIGPPGLTSFRLGDLPDLIPYLSLLSYSLTSCNTGLPVVPAPGPLHRLSLQLFCPAPILYLPAFTPSARPLL